uniref:Putative tetratricopeptide repeat protein n=1 Tax=viral metagenome TaxID=1070528 RepID=A0A6M3IIL2_9ZZZZ
MARKKLAIFLISGNEQRWMKQWCESTMKVDPDLVIVNLTAYDDDTERLLREGIPEDRLILVKFPWKADFSEARNHCLDLVPDWVDILGFQDADETFTDDFFVEMEKIRNEDSFPPSLLLTTIYNTLDCEGLVASLFYPRFWFRRDAKRQLINEHFENSVHNQLIIDLEAHPLEVIRTNLSIKHYGYSLDKESMRKKHARSEELLRNQLKEDPDSFFAHLNLAQLLRARGDYIGTEKHAREVLRIVGQPGKEKDERLNHARLMASEQLSTALFSKRDFHGSIEWADYGLAIKTDYLDAVINKANSLLELHQYEDARFWYNRYLFVKSRYNEFRDNSNLILNHLNSSFICLYNIGMICGIQNDIKGAAEFFKKSYDQQPDFRDSFIKYIHSLRLLEKYDEMNAEINKYMQNHSDHSYLVYSYFGDSELERCNVENAKINYYQAVHLAPTDSQDLPGLKHKWDSIKTIFGDVASIYFDTSKNHQSLTKKMA